MKNTEIIFKIIMKTQTLFLIYIHVSVLEWGEHMDLSYVLTKKLKRFIKIHLIFESLITKW